MSNQTTVWTLSTLAGSLGLLLALGGPAQSAEQPQSAAAAPVTDTGGALDEIVVTATKRAESLQVVPITVDVVSQSALQSANYTDTADLHRLVPNLQFLHTSTPGNDAFGIRGVSTLASGYGLEQSVGIAFDGVPLARPVGSVADLVDIQRVETVEGPQGMLFGKNASAGLINIISNSPELGKTDTVARASFGSLNERQYSATTNVAVTDDSALRLTAWKFSHDGPIHEVNTGQDMGDQNSDGGRLGRPRGL
jgi:iron complex outermembrane receptor protein